MSLKSNNIIYVYNSGDEDSVKLAEEFAYMRQVPTSNMLGVDTFTTSILESRTQFVDQILNPLKEKIESLGGFGELVQGCVLGYRIPAGYNSEYGVISSCSAVSAMFLSDGVPIYNPAYRQNTKTSKLYGFKVFPTCQQDMPNFNLMKKKISDFALFRNGITVDGSFYFDRWSLKEDFAYDVYAAELQDFEEKFISKYVSKYFVTSEPIDDLRSDFGFANNDSFFWSAGLQNLTQSYFRNNNRANRVFFFNADEDSFVSFRSNNEFGPAIAALNAGYVGAAGMMSGFESTIDINPYSTDPYEMQQETSVSCWIRPEPFFQAISQGITLLESMYYASPILCCPMTYFTDPMMTVDVTGALAVPEKISTSDGWLEIHYKLSEAGALINNRSIASSRLISRVGTHNGLDDKLWAIKNYGSALTGNSITTLRSLIDPALSGWKKYIEVAYFDKITQTIPNFLRSVNEVDFKLTNAFININLNNAQIYEEIESSNIETKGMFIIDTYLPERNIGTGYFQVKAEVYEDIDDEEPLITSYSYNDTLNWSFEDFDKSMKPYPVQGIFSSLKNRKIRFINRRFIQNKNIGNKVWVIFTYILNDSAEIVSDRKEAMIIS